MKATLTFNLPDENSEFNTAINGPRYWSVLWDLEQEMRACVKHEGVPMNDTKTHETIEATEHWRERLHSLCADQGVDIYEE